MKNTRLHVLWALSALVFTAGCASTPAARVNNAGHPANERIDLPAGFLVLAPDRGFLGNEELRDAFAELAAELTQIVGRFRFRVCKRGRQNTFCFL